MQELYLNHLNYYKSAMSSVTILAGVGIFFFITLKQSYSETFQMLSWGKKNPKCQNLTACYLWVEAENNMR